MRRWLWRMFGTDVVMVWRDGRPAAWAIGWAERMPDGWVSYLERVYVRPGYRGRSRGILRELHQRWMDRADRLGYPQVIVQVDRRRPALLAAGRRWAGFEPYADEGRYIWCLLGRPA